MPLLRAAWIAAAFGAACGHTLERAPPPASPGQAPSPRLLGPEDETSHAADARPTAQVAPGAASPLGISDGSASPEARCDAVSKAPRTFVGLTHSMTLDDFEDAAYEAERISLAVSLALCTLAPPLADGPLRAVLASEGLEITDILLTADDMSSADVRLRQRLPSTAAQPAERWRLKVSLRHDRWKVQAIMQE